MLEDHLSVVPRFGISGLQLYQLDPKVYNSYYKAVVLMYLGTLYISPVPIHYYAVIGCHIN